VYQQVDGPGGNLGQWTSLALGVGGTPHISYFDWANSDLKYAFFDGAAWQARVVDDAGGVGLFTSLALDQVGVPRISYFDDTNGDLRYAYFDGTVWQLQTVDSVGRVGWDTSLAVDEAGRAHISYFDLSYGDLRYALQDGTGWVTQTVDSAGDVGLYTSLALDTAGLPRIAYYDFSHYDLRYACFDGETWVTQTVDPICGGHMSLALDAAGLPRISYTGQGHLRYARALGPCSAPAEGVALDWVPPTPRVGAAVAFSATASGTLPLAFTWDLGDGTTAGGATVTHAYSTEGLYTVTVTATNCGGSSVAREAVLVLPPYRIYLPLVQGGGGRRSPGGPACGSYS
jgi:hypothetical protein